MLKREDVICPLIKEPCIKNRCMAWSNKPMQKGDTTIYVPMCKLLQDSEEQLGYINNYLDNEVQELKKTLEETCMEQLQNLKGLHITHSTLIMVRNKIIDTLSEFRAAHSSNNDRQYIDFRVEQNPINPSQILIKPINLFSYLLFKGVDVTYEQVKNKKEYKTEKGIYTFKNGECGFIHIDNGVI